MSSDELESSGSSSELDSMEVEEDIRAFLADQDPQEQELPTQLNNTVYYLYLLLFCDNLGCYGLKAIGNWPH